MPSLSDNAIMMLIAAPVIAALVWLLKSNATAAREREVSDRAAVAKRDLAQAETLQRFANAADKQADATATWAAATATNSAVMHGLTGAIDRLNTSLTAEVRGIREDLDECTPNPARATRAPRAVLDPADERKLQRGKKEE